MERLASEKEMERKIRKIKGKAMANGRGRKAWRSPASSRFPQQREERESQCIRLSKKERGRMW
jgi:hypothetical protein